MDEQRGDDLGAEEGSAASASAAHPGYDRAGADLPHEFSVRDVRAWMLRPPERSGNRNASVSSAPAARCLGLATTMEIAQEFRLVLERGGRIPSPMWIQAGLASVMRNIASGTEATYGVSIGSRRGNTGTAQKRALAVPSWRREYEWL